jgi:hypothetical protein
MYAYLQVNVIWYIIMERVGLKAYKNGIVYLSFGITVIIAIFTIMFITAPSAVQLTEPPLPQGIPPDTLRNFLDKDGYIVESYGLWTMPVEGKRINFDYMYSIKGLWTGSNAKLTIILPNNSQAVFSAETNHDTWGNSLETFGNHISKAFNPWLEVTLFNLGKENYGVLLNATAEMDIVSPQLQNSTWGLKFANENNHLIRNISFLLISSEEFQMLSAHNAWLSAHNSWVKANDTDPWNDTWSRAQVMIILAFFFSFFPFLFALVGALKLVKVYHDRKSMVDARTRVRLDEEGDSSPSPNPIHDWKKHENQRFLDQTNALGVQREEDCRELKQHIERESSKLTTVSRKRKTEETFIPLKNAGIQCPLCKKNSVYKGYSERGQYFICTECGCNFWL